MLSKAKTRGYEPWHPGQPLRVSDPSDEMGVQRGASVKAQQVKQEDPSSRAGAPAPDVFCDSCHIVPAELRFIWPRPRPMQELCTFCALAQCAARAEAILVQAEALIVEQADLDLDLSQARAIVDTRLPPPPDPESAICHHITPPPPPPPPEKRRVGSPEAPHAVLRRKEAAKIEVTMPLAPICYVWARLYYTAGTQ